MRKRHLFYLYCFIAATFTVSCVSQHKVSSTKKQLSTQDSLLQQYANELKQLDEKRSSKENLNLIDDTSNSRIHAFIEKTNAEIDRLHKDNTIMIGEVVIKKDDWDQLRTKLSVCLNATKRLSGKIMLLTDLINHNTVLKLDQDLLFEPGKFEVSPGVAESIGKVFDPVAKAIDSFTLKYPGFPLSLAITAKGYADATDISDNSPLYKDLGAEITFSGLTLTRENLNQALSNLRAKSVIHLFQNYSSSRKSSGNIIFVYKGKGEEFPDPAVTDYKKDDVRRRVVLLYWSVFPDY
jgi:outer membrane protein OmpA-like peptidoglycan-associated protein